MPELLSKRRFESVIDRIPVLDKALYSFAEAVSDYEPTAVDLDAYDEVDACIISLLDSLSEVEEALERLSDKFLNGLTRLDEEGFVLDQELESEEYEVG